MLVAIGDNCIDRYLPPIAVERVGGNAVNVAANVASRGLRAAYAGVVGDDEPGTRIINSLLAVGVNVDCVLRAHGPTGLTEIQIKEGDYTIVLEDYGVSERLEVTEPMRRFLAAGAARIHLTATGKARALIRELSSLSLPISVDLGIARSPHDLHRFEELLPFVSEAFMSAGSEAEDVVVEAALERAILLGARSAIATRGARGCSAFFDGRLFAAPSDIAAADIVDPLGAGDAFIAGYLSTLEVGAADASDGVERSLRIASAWAAQACKHLGGWPGAER